MALQMRQRRICFDPALAAAPLTLYYGDPSLGAPRYKDGVISPAAPNPRVALLGPEASNPNFIAASATPKVAQHRLVLRWIAVLGCVCIFALLVIRRTHRMRY